MCVLLSFESWELLRGDHGLGAPEVVQVWAEAVAALAADVPVASLPG